MLKTILKKAALHLALALVLGQVVRPDRTNPSVDPTKALAASGHAPPDVVASLGRACRDCHTSETVWPWYTNVTPISWWVAHHVEEGRGEVSFSNWGDLGPQQKARKLAEICEEVEEKGMPLPSYLLIHAEARLSDAERQAICEWTKTEVAAIGPLPPDPDRARGSRE